MFACLGFIFMALLEMAVVAFNDKVQGLKEERREEMAQNDWQSDSEIIDMNSLELMRNGADHVTKNHVTKKLDLMSNFYLNLNGDVAGQKFNSLKRKKRRRSKSIPERNKKINAGVLIDRVSSILFPVAFFVFNVCYWGYYVYKSNS